MNVAVKTANRAVAFPRLIKLDKHHLSLVSLVMIVLVSAFSLIYVKDMNRRLVGESQTLQNTYENLRIEHSQLLLEKSTWSSQARIEKIAEHRLNMVMPRSVSVITV